MHKSSDDPPNRLETLILCLIFAGVSLALLWSLDTATRPGRTTAGWWTKPAFAPGVALAVLCFANVWTLARQVWQIWRDPPGREEWRGAGRSILAWLLPLEFLAYFAAYVWALGILGYLPATLIFVLGLSWRAGLRSLRWALAGVALSFAMVAVFRWGLGVWMPTPAFYDAFPAPWRSWAIRFF